VLGLNVMPVPIIEVADKFREQLPTTKLLIYTETCDDLCLQSLLDAGVSGCVLKEEPVDELVTAIQVIANGGTYFSRLALTGLARAESETALNPLTEREQEILQLMAQGMSNRQIAEILLITARTVKFHTANIYSKLGGLSRAETIAWAWKNGMVNGDET
jgi:two-component system nitrate/nitrite response regulator NarL